MESGEDPEEKGYSPVYSYGGLDTVGYVFLDLDEDGFDELYIGPADWPTDSEEGTPVYDMFMQSQGKVYHVFSGGERDFLTIPENGEGVVIERGSNGADSSVINFWNMYIPEGNLTLGTSLIYDGETDPENPYYISYSEDESDRESISEEDWNMHQDNYGEDQVLTFQKLADYIAE